MKKDYFSLSVLITTLVIISFLAGFITQKEMNDEGKRDTLIFKSPDSVKLYVVLQDGKLQSFWYSKTKKWKIKPTISK